MKYIFVGDSGRKQFLVWHFYDQRMQSVTSNQATKKHPPRKKVKSRKTGVTKTGTRRGRGDQDFVL